MKEYTILCNRIAKIKNDMALLMEYVKTTKDTESDTFRLKCKKYHDLKADLLQLEAEKEATDAQLNALQLA